MAASAPFTSTTLGRSALRTRLLRALAATAVVGSSLVGLVGSGPSGAVGESLSVVVTQQDGTPAWDANDAAGHDSGPANGIVRTNDNLTYQVEVNVADAAATNVTFTLPLPQGVELSVVPPFCTGPGSTLTPGFLGEPSLPVSATSWTALGTQVLVCNVGSRTANSTFTYPVVTRVRPEVPQGADLALTPVTVVSDDVPTPVASGSLHTTVSARAQYDISKNSMAAAENTGRLLESLVDCPDPLGAPGAMRQCFQYTTGILISAPSGGKGLSPLASPVTFTDDLTPTSIYGAGVLTDPQWTAAGANALARYGAVLSQCQTLLASQPGSAIGLPNGAGTLTDVDSVRDSGSTTCTQPGGPGTAATVSIVGMDSTAYTYPAEAAVPAGSPTPADKAYVYSMAIRFLIPTDAVRDLGVASVGANGASTWTLPWDNRFTGFAPTDVGGRTNLPAANVATNDHRGSNAVLTQDGAFNKFYVGIPGATGNTPPEEFSPASPAWEGPAGSTGRDTGEGQLFAGASTLSSLNFINSSTVDAPVTFLGCDSWDNTRLQLTSRVTPGGALIPGGVDAQLLGSTGAPVWLSGFYSVDGWATTAADIPTIPLQIQYGTGPGGSGAASSCDDAASPDGWSTDPGSFAANDPALEAQGVYTAVTRVRVRAVVPSPSAGGARVVVQIGLHSVPGQAPGTILPNWAAMKLAPGTVGLAGMLDPSRTWTRSTYDPSTAIGRLGDRLRISSALARLRKEVKDPVTGVYSTATPNFTGGQVADYLLEPTLTAGIETDATVPVIIEDCIPAGVVFLPASAAPTADIVAATAPPGSGIACNPGETYVRWDLGPLPIGQSLPIITYSGEVGQATPAGTLPNVAQITADGDVSSAESRQASVAIQVTQPAGVAIDKTSLTPVVEVNRTGESTQDPLVWRIDLANIETTPGPTDIDVIDVLPVDGLGGSHFSGTLTFDQAAVLGGNKPGQTVELLSTADAPVNPDAAAPSNHPVTGATVWCSRSGATFTRVLGAGTSADCPASAAAVTGLRIRRPGEFSSGDLISAELSMVPSGNAAGDVYVNSVEGRATGLALPVGPAPSPAEVVGSSIGDRVWEDTNHNGVQDSGEPGIEGFTVTLTGTDTDGNTVGPLTTSTSPTGQYLFANLASGTYQVTFDPASLTATQQFTTVNAGPDDTADSDGDAATGSVDVLLGIDRTNLTVDQGVFTSAPAVSITKFINGDDANAAPGALTEPGDPLDVTFEVVNTGNVTLDPVVVTDDTIDAADIDCPQTALDPDESMTCTASVAALAAGEAHINVGSVEATPAAPPGGPALPDVSDDDPAHATGIDRSLTIDKAVVGSPVANGDGTTTVTYDVTVTSTGNVATSYDLNDELRFGDGVTVESAAVTSSPAGVTLHAGWDGQADTLIAGAVALPVDAVHTYRVVAVVSTDPTVLTGTSADCTLDAGESGTGLLNTATVAHDGTSVDDSACAALAHTTFTKRAVGPPVRQADGSFAVAYDLTVINDGGADDIYDLADALQFGAGITVDSAEVSNTTPGSITTNPSWDGSADTGVVSGASIAAGDTHIYRVLVAASVATSATTAATDCTLGAGESGTGFANTGTLTVNGDDQTDQACVSAPNTTVSKALVGSPVIAADGTATVTYEITVANTGAGADSYELEDQLQFGAGITIDAASVANTTPGSIVTNPAWDGAADISIVTGQALPGSTTHVYEVVVDATVPADLSQTDGDCTLGGAEPGTGFLNRAVLHLSGFDQSDSACAPAVPGVVIDKALVGSPVPNGDGTTTVTYDITVTGSADGATTYDLDDELRFGAGVTVESATVTSSPAGVSLHAGWNGQADTLIAAGASLPASAVHSYRVVVVVATDPAVLTGSGSDCTLDAGESGTGLLNTATVSHDGTSAEASACGALPHTTMTKALVGPPVRQSDGTFAVAYDLTVTNDGAADDSYDLADALQFGAGITVDSAEVSNTTPGSITTNPAWDGIANTNVVSGEAIAAGDTHTYRVLVGASVAAGAPTAGTDCTVGGGESGTGFANTGTLTVNGADQTDDACASAPNTAVTKSLVGAPAIAADGSATVTYEITVANTGAGADSYDLDDQLQFGAGITIDTATVTNATPGSIVTNPAWDGVADTSIVTGQALPGSTTHVYEVTVDASVPAGISQADGDCTLGGQETGTGFLNSATLRLAGFEQTDTACGSAVASVLIDKALVGSPVPNGDGTTTVTYDITVTGSADGATPYDLDDELRFGAGVTVESASVTSSPAGVSLHTGWNGQADTLIAGGATLPASAVHTYRVVVVVATDPAVLTGASSDCTLDAGESGTGLLNTATVTHDGTSAEASACGALPHTTITKALVGPPVRQADGSFALAYDLTVTNDGAADDTYDLADALAFGSGITVDSASVANTTPGSITTNPGWDGIAVTQVVTGETITAGESHVYRVIAGALVATTSTTASTDCTLGAGESGTGFTNTGTLTVNGADQSDEACATAPNTTVSKALAGSPVIAADGTATVTYEITVTNGGAGADSYDLEDQLQFGAGITIDAATVANTTPGSITTNPGWDGVANTSIVTGQSLPGSTTHVYEVTVDATVPVDISQADGDCTLGGQEMGTGFLNSATLTLSGFEQTDTACGSAVASVLIDKALVGSPVPNGDGTTTVTYDITVTGSADGATIYDLNDELRFGAGVTVESAAVTSGPAGVSLHTGWNGQADTLIAAGASLPAGAVHTYRVVVVVAADPAVLTGSGSDCTLDAGESGTGLLNTATVTHDGTSAEASACGALPHTILTKRAVGPPVRQADGSFAMAYDLTVTNDGAADDTYNLADALHFGTGITVDSASVANTTPGSITTNPAWDGIADTSVVSGEAITAGDTHTYRVAVSATVSATATPGATDCTMSPGESGTGFANVGTATINGDDRDDQACLAAPNTTIRKDVVGTPTVAADGTVTITYAITVANRGGGADSYGLDDTLRFGNGITIAAATVANTTPGSIVTNPAWDGVADTSIVAGQALPAATTHVYEVQVAATVGSGATVTDTDCSLGTGEDGTGFLNEAEVHLGSFDASDTACDDAAPDVQVIKSLVGAPTANGDGTWTIDYDLQVNNVGPVPTTYDLADELALGRGVSVLSSSVVNTVPGTLVTNPAWDGISDTEVVAGQAIATGETHHYRVRLEASVATAIETAATDCTIGSGESGSGFANRAQLTYGGSEAEDVACAPVPAVRVTKEVIGTPSVADDGTVVVNYRLTVRNDGAGSGHYDLDDELAWGVDLTVTGVQVLTTPAGATADPAWDGAGTTRLASNIALAAGATHLWDVQVTGTIAAGAASTVGDCTLAGAEAGTGTLNIATVSADGVVSDDDACVALSRDRTPTPTPTPTHPDPTPGELPYTGSDMAGLASVGFVLVVSGAGLWGLAWARRRRMAR